MNFLDKFSRRVCLEGLEVSFHRTCRVPQGRINSLPAGLGYFPVYKVSDFKSGVPKDWQEDGIFFPMYKSEAMWMSFSIYGSPKALIVAAGNINAISGKPFQSRGNKGNLDIKLEEKQNYLVIPPQPWIDGWKAQDGKVYQFVAAEMGSGETVGGQITGEEKFGGIQLISYGPKPGQTLIRESVPGTYISAGYSSFNSPVFGYSPSLESVECCSQDFRQILCNAKGHSRKSTFSDRVGASVQSMGLGRGGEIEQKIYPDSYGKEVWSETPLTTTRIYMVSSADFKQITGYDAPPTPVTYEKYQRYGYPWFDLFDEKFKDSKGSSVFDKIKPVSGGLDLSKKGALVKGKAKKEKVNKLKLDKMFEKFKG